MKLLVTGAHGLLGRSLLRAAVGRSGLEASGCGRGAQGAPSGDYHVCDLLDPKAVRGILDRVEPDWVIHTAAVPNVDLCEAARELARRVNVEAVADLAAACRESGIGLPHLSTDYVFDGRDGPYGENDSTHPISHYGALKLASEKPVLEGGLDGLVVRTLWLYGHASGVRPNLVTWPLQALAKGEELRIVDDQWGNPAAVDDLAEALLELCQRRQTGLVHFGGGDFMTRYELVVALAREFALPVDRIHPISTAAMGQPAPRPLRSGLRAELREAILGRGPITFACGLERLRAQEDFHRDFPAHVR